MLAMSEYSGLSQRQIREFQEQGYLIVRGAISPGEAAAIGDAFMQMASNGPVEGLSEIRHGGREAYNANDPLSRYPRMMHPHRHVDKPVGPMAMRYMLDPRIGRILKDLFGEEVVAAQSMFYFKPPGARGQDFHQDNFYLRVRPGTCMAAWMAIDDADEGNGGMVLVPGSHKLGIICPEKADDSRFFTTEHLDTPPGMQQVPATMKAGDVLFFNGSVIHGSYPNTSKERFRRALICHYLPESASEISQWYKPLYRFDGRETQRAFTSAGGPCGTLAEAMGPH